MLIIIGLELDAGYWLQNKTIYAIPGLIQDPDGNLIELMQDGTIDE